jgi:hypothetical protein
MPVRDEFVSEAAILPGRGASNANPAGGSLADTMAGITGNTIAYPFSMANGLD